MEKCVDTQKKAHESNMKSEQGDMTKYRIRTNSSLRIVSIDLDQMAKCTLLVFIGRFTTLPERNILNKAEK